ncbi:MAG: ATP-dependent sacrificial sulfur transferase LarE [Lachnospiraceae bacterium]|nr:ATP-dependent sacrificial sulfur transferase LarE [Lachnospiraceae bacterium]
MQEKSTKEKYDELKEYISSFGSGAVAYSGGTDSTFLLYVAKKALGRNLIAVISVSSLIPEYEVREAKDYCKTLGVKQLSIEQDILDIEGFSANPTDRCYLCKNEIFKNIKRIALKENMNAIFEGSNADDESDYRPGCKALKELGIISPLQKVGLTKKEIRELSRLKNIPMWDKPSSACLASRIPYGEEVNENKLKMIEKCENYLRELGFRQYRVRHYGLMAKVEILPEDFDKFMEEKTRFMVEQYFKHVGFVHIALDISGFKSGKMNEGLDMHNI